MYTFEEQVRRTRELQGGEMIVSQCGRWTAT